VLVPLLPRVIRKRRDELAKVGGDLVAPGDRALVGRLSDRVLSVKRFEGLRIALQYRVSDAIHDLTCLSHVRLLSSTETIVRPDAPAMMNEMMGNGMMGMGR
jgi:hypothetical protein